mgnify:CR=1 FL=1
MKKLRVLLVDDEIMIREGFKSPPGTSWHVTTKNVISAKQPEISYPWLKNSGVKFYRLYILFWFCVIIMCCRSSSRKEVYLLDDFFTTLLVTVLANVISYYICKWLSGRQ